MSHKVLVVDDDEGIIDAITLILEDAGYHVKSTMKAEEIYDLIKTFRPDVILLDVLMSGYDGRSICKKLKEGMATRKIPVIMISAHPTAKESTLKSGADGFLAKPFELDALLNLLAEKLSSAGR